MGKAKRERGRERRQMRRRLLPLAGRLRLVVGALAAAAVVAVAIVVAVAALGGDDGSPAAANPTPGATASVATPTPDTRPPPIPGQPTYTSSGLGFVDITEGSGPTPEPGQTVVVEYTGWLSNGKMIASSVGREPFEFALDTGQVIAGWEEGLATMKVGGKRRLLIPPDLAYGEEGRPPAIPSNERLTFDIELLGIK